MAINKVRINNLFNQYDITIDLTKECTILIGPNGVGKSTILKILSCLVRRDFVNIIASPFNSMEITFDKAIDMIEFSPNTLALTYNDFLPDPDAIIKQYERWISLSRIITYPDTTIPETPTNEQLIKYFKNAISEICANDIYGQFIYNCYIKKEPIYAIKSILNKYDINYESILKSNIVRVDDKLFLYSTVHEIITNYNYNLSHFLEQYDNNFYYLDLVSKISLENNLIDRPILYYREIEWITDDTSRHFKDPMACLECRTTDYKYAKYGIPLMLVSKSNGKIFEAYKELLKSDMVLVYGRTYEKSELESILPTYNKKTIEDYCFEDLLNNQVLDINFLIAKHYYEKSFIDNINKAIREYTLDLLENDLNDDEHPSHEFNKQEYLEATQILEFYNPEVVNDYNNFIRPVIFGNCLLNFINLERALETYKNDLLKFNFYDITKLKCLMMFYKKYIKDLKNPKNKNNKIKQLETLLQKYMTDKHIQIDPSGLRIRTKVHHEKEKNCLFIKYNNEDIDFSMLSSGETKIILLFSLAIFMENKTLFIDEPELSLSLVWQEALINDLLQIGNLKSMIIATHSPYIAKSENLSNYIKFLPSKKGE